LRREQLEQEQFQRELQQQQQPQQQQQQQQQQEQQQGRQGRQKVQALALKPLSFLRAAAANPTLSEPLIAPASPNSARLSGTSHIALSGLFETRPEAETRSGEDDVADEDGFEM